MRVALIIYFFFFFLSFFGPCHVACGMLVPWTGIKPRPSKWSHRILTIGWPGNSLFFFFFKNKKLRVSSQRTECDLHFLVWIPIETLGLWNIYVCNIRHYGFSKVIKSVFFFLIPSLQNLWFYPECKLYTHRLFKH